MTYSDWQGHSKVMLHMLATAVAAIPAIPVESAVSGGVSIGAGMVVAKAIIELMFKRIGKREDDLERANTVLIANMQTQIDALLVRVKEAEEAVDECREHRGVDQEEIYRLRGLLNGVGDVRQVAATLVAAERLKDKDKLSETLIEKLEGKDNG